MNVEYSLGFKEQAIEKALNRGKQVTVREVAKNLGIGCSTLMRWIQESKAGRLSGPQRGTEKGVKRPLDWCPSEKLKAVIESGTMTDKSLGSYCREQGLFPHQLAQWKQELLAMPSKLKDDDQAEKAENRRLKEENKRLKRELNRKEKALAEAAALLVLKKKADALWGLEEDD